MSAATMRTLSTSPPTLILYHAECADGFGAAWAICWTAEGGLARESYVNLIPTPAGGTHESGLRQATLDAIKGLSPRGVPTPLSSSR